MRLPLRWKILLITVITPLSLGLAAMVTVNRNVERHVDSSSIQENLEHSIRVFEGMLATRGHALKGGSEVIAYDPRFFSLLTLRPAQRDSRFIATVRGMARDFNKITRTELFDVLDRGGRPLASVGSVAASPALRDSLSKHALRGESAVKVLVLNHLLYQVSVTPVRSDGRIVGVLLLGSEIGERLARELRGQMRCEVSFVAGSEVTSTTLENPADRRALLDRLVTATAESHGDLRHLGRIDVKGADMTYVTVLRPIPGSTPADPLLYVMQRASDPETDFLHLMQRDMGFLALVGVIAALITGLALSASITRPIVQLVKGAQEMQKGNYTYAFKVKSSDEIGFLADRFKEMRQREAVYVQGLEEATRLKSEFITVASHELRTPISVIQGYYDLLREGGIGPIAPAQRQALDGIKGCLHQLTHIAEQAGLVAQVQSRRLELNRVEQTIGPILERAIGSAQAASPNREVQVKMDANGAQRPIAVDGDLLVQAITNLVTNAIRFTPDGRQMGVEAHEHGDYLEILVWDEGPGIAEERLSQIFDHGYSMNNPLHHHSSSELEFNSRGLGVGLGITRGIVEAHGGAVNASNRSEGGSLFRVRLPHLDRTEQRNAA
jgi:signal transduction histidine kinase